MDLNIDVPSFAVNVINFIIVEALLNSLIFFLTADVSGRLNYLSLIDGDQKKMIVYSPPVVGGGVCSTNYFSFLSMLSIRVLSVLCIFGTALTIDGGMLVRYLFRKAIVQTPAPLGNTTTAEFRKAISKRTKCQTTANGYIYHGLLYSDGYCEHSTAFLQDQIRYSAYLQSVSVILRNCTETKVQTHLKYSSYKNFNCSNGLLSCASIRDDFHPDWCRGTLETPAGQYVCPVFTSRESSNWTGDCYQSFNIGLVNDNWIHTWKVSAADIIDSIGALSILGQKSMDVGYIGFQYSTDVSKIWFAFASLQVVFVITLVCISICLKYHGANSILNDEVGLANLLGHSLSEDNELPYKNCKLYLHHKKIGEKLCFWASTRPPQLARNRRLHDEERKYYAG